MTNWNSYYESPFPSSRISRMITANLLIRLIRRYVRDGDSSVVVELGGANSCFLDIISTRIRPREYHIVDNNQAGMDLLKVKPAGDFKPILHIQDVRNLRIAVTADLIFSVGLVEHFGETELPGVVAAHFTYLKPGGTAIITFPTPTFLYKSARRISERLGLWIFNDEVPIPVNRMVDLTSQYGKILHVGINWPILFTQGIIVIKKRGVKTA